MLILLQNLYFIIALNKRDSQKTLYQELTQAPYGIRKGVLPLLIGYQLRNYYDDITVFYKNKEIPLSSTLLSNINDNPEGYEISLEQNTLERRNYLETLYTIFLPDVPVGTSVYPVVKEIQWWILSLPEYSKYYTKEPSGEPLNPSFQSVRHELLKFEVNPRTLIYETIPELMGTIDNYFATAEAVGQMKQHLESHTKRCQEQLITETKVLFAENYKGSITEALKLWYKGISGNIIQRSSKELLHFIKNLKSHNELEVLESLIQIYVSMSLADWNDGSPEMYFNGLRQSITYCETQTKEENQIDQPIEKKAEREKIKKRNNIKSQPKVEISPMGETLRNNLLELIGEYQAAIEPEETMAILTSLMEEI